MRRVGLASVACMAAGVTLAHAAPYRAPHLSWGAPDLEGVWSNASLTMLMRRPNMPGPVVVPEKDVREAERKLAAAIDAPSGDDLGQANSEWRDDAHIGRVDGEARASWIVDPADGVIPYTAEGLKRRAKMSMDMDAGFDNPEQRPNSERCLIGSQGSNGPPLNNWKYASNFQIVQTPDAVAIYSEMVHDVRVIRLNAAHAPANIRPWMGDSVGRWDGETLVVETTNFNPREGDRNNYYFSPEARLEERFTRTSPTEIRYTFTVTDPAIYRQPWRAEMALHPGPATILEYACHEGNYSMRGALAGARREEALKAGK